MSIWPKLFLIVLAFLVPVSSYAARALYGGIQYAAINFTEPGIGEFDPAAVVVRVGERFNDKFAVEGRLGANISGDNGPLTSIEAEISKMAGLYGSGK